MRITGGTLFLTFAIFLDSIELIRSTVKLDALFPGYYGVLPPVKKFLGNIQDFHNFLYCNGQPNEIHGDATLLVRYQVIVGWRWEDHILPPCTRLSGEFVVFNRTDPVSNGHWVALSADDFRKLGPLRRYSLVKARDRVAQRNNVPRNSTQGILRKHKKACIYANAAANEVEERELERLAREETTIPNIIGLVEYYYNHIYQNVYNNVLNNPNQASGSRGGTP